MTLPSTTNVLVVGAGPAGMAAALSLRTAGITDITVVDAVEQGLHTSRAMVIHAATLELLDTIGAADSLVEAGIKVPKMTYYDRKNALLQLDFDSLSEYTRFPYYLLIPQHITERVLDQKLKERNIPVHRPYKAVSMRENAGDKRKVDVAFENGESITARYVIGADGATSAIRQACNISFFDPAADPTKPENETLLAQMVIADVTFKTPPRSLPHAMTGVLSQESFFASAPLEYPIEGSKDHGNKTIYRIACGVPLTFGAPPSRADASYVQELINKFGPEDLSSEPSNPYATEVEQVVWSTRFRTRCATADRFFTYFGDDGSMTKPGAVVCLIGDAAHIHPPAGGQGMNLGLRDAITLGPVIAGSMMEGYSPEADAKVAAHMHDRHERAKDVIKITKVMVGAMGMSPSLRDSFAWSPIHIYTIRDWVVWGLGKSAWFRKTMAYRFSGLAAM